MPPFLLECHAILFGFAVSALVATGFEAMSGRRAGFRLLHAPDASAALAVPVVTLAAPFILARNLYAPRSGRSPLHVLIGSLVAGVWSLILGAAALSALT